MKERFPLFHLTYILCVLLCFQSLGTSDTDIYRMFPYSSTKDKPCISPCERRGGKEYWCNVGKSRRGYIYEYEGWDYCSKLGQTYKGDSCYGSCQSHKDYFFCYTDYKEKTWDYCGPLRYDYTSPVENQHYTCKGVPCISECEFPTGEEKSRCHKAGGSWGHCSVKPDVDIKGQRCSSECEYADGTSYSWCWVDKENNKWDYCGKVTIAVVAPVAAAFEATTTQVVMTLKTEPARKPTTTTTIPPEATFYEFDSLPEVVTDDPIIRQ